MVNRDFARAPARSVDPDERPAARRGRVFGGRGMARQPHVAAGGARPRVSWPSDTAPSRPRPR